MHEQHLSLIVEFLVGVGPCRRRFGACRPGGDVYVPLERLGMSGESLAFGTVRAVGTSCAGAQFVPGTEFGFLAVPLCSDPLAVAVRGKSATAAMICK